MACSCNFHVIVDIHTVNFLPGVVIVSFFTHPFFSDVLNQLEAYFNGYLRHFDLDLDLTAGTPFQQKVWQELQKIPYGQTISYGELAARIGNPNAFRAVGMANGKNPISIIVPCHRVIGKDGSLTGFGGGIDVKKQLLCLEQKNGAIRPVSGYMNTKTAE